MQGSKFCLKNTKSSSAISCEIYPHETGSGFRPGAAPMLPSVRLMIDDAGNAPRLHDRFKVTVSGVSRGRELDKPPGMSVSTLLKLSGCGRAALPEATAEG